MRFLGKSEDTVACEQLEAFLFRSMEHYVSVVLFLGESHLLKCVMGLEGRPV